MTDQPETTTSDTRSRGDADESAPQTKTLYLIDAFAQLFRAYHAIRSNLTSPVTQEPTNATFGWVGMLLKILREYQPDYLAIAIDVSGDRHTFRSDIYPEYKANREPPPMDFRPQIERSFEIARMMNIPILGIERFEADDIIASIVRRLDKSSERENLRIRIVSKDKDLEQLLSDRVELFDVHKDHAITLETLREKRGIEPHQVRDMLALMGDTSDNVPGVPGIGPKTAAQLVSQYGDIDNLYAHIDEFKGKRRENLEASRDVVKLSRTLVTLNGDLDPEFDLGDARVDTERIPVEELAALFKTLGFNRYQQDLLALTGSVASNEKSDETNIANSASSSPPSSSAPQNSAPAGSLFAQVDSDSVDTTQHTVTTVEPKRGKYECITTTDQLDQLIDDIRKVGRISIDTETTSLSTMEAELCGISIALEEKTGAYIPVQSPDPSSHLNTEQVLDRLRPVLEDASIGKVGQNLKYDWIIFKNHGVDLNRIAGDSMIASYLFDASRSSHSLNTLAQALLDYYCIPISELIGERARGKTQCKFSEIPVEFAHIYAAEDADVALRLVNFLEPKLNVMGLRPLYDDVEIPLVEILASMQYHGIRVDPDILDAQREIISRRITQIRKKILDAAPSDFNPDSPRQLARILFNPVDDPEAPGLGLKVIKRGKSGPSTDIEVLEKLADDPSVETIVPQLIVEYRQLTKLVNTYLVALKNCINIKTGRVHASFNQTVAATGRLSSSDPNLQNIPIRTEVGRQIRKAFVAEPGCKLITADYSQIELRLLAHLSGDEALTNAFLSGEDIHRTVASQVYDVPLDEVTREQRSSAKMVNFGIVYGITPFGLARRLGHGVTNEQAAQIIDDYKARFPGINEFLKRCVDEARDHGFVETILKRRRAVPQVHSRNPREKMLGERMAINSVVQGSAADLIKLAMVNLYRKLPDQFPNTRMLLQIHDELVFESPIDEADAALKFVVNEMETSLDLKVSLKVDADLADNWLEGK